MSGLAHVIHNEIRLKYLAGTSPPPLVSTLLWLSESRSLIHLTANRARSWSRAAYDGPNQFLRPLLPEVDELNFISVSGDPIPELPETGLPKKGLFYQGPLSLEIQALVISLSTIQIAQNPTTGQCLTKSQKFAYSIRA